MTNYAQLDALQSLEAEPNIPMPSGRRIEHSALDIHQAENQSAQVKRLMAKLQHRFSDSADVAYLIESEVNQRTTELVRRANYDSLTHLPNRAYFHDILENLIQRSKQDKLPFSLLFLDLDGFKVVNDTLGHHVGDELLRHVSGRLVASVREGDIVSRLGGDEFVILLAELNHRAEIEVICQRIIKEITKPYWFDGQEVRTSTSIGIASFPDDTTLSSELIERADQALYISKTCGKQTFRFYDDVQATLQSSSHKTLEVFEKALQSGSFDLEIEPQIDLKQQRIVGGMIKPVWLVGEHEKLAISEWRSLLAQSGKGLSLATWLLDSGCFFAKQWTEQQDEFVVTVPILDALAAKAELVSILLQKLQQFDLMPSQCQFAFSLQQLSTVDGLSSRLADLSEQGGLITLTGIGGTPLDLSGLACLSVQEFKFDGDWLGQAMTTESGRKWVQALIQMGKSLDICLIATQVASEDEARLLSQWGCQLGQGEYWATPESCGSFNP